MPTFDLRGLLRRPLVPCTVLAVVLRLGTLAWAWTHSPILRRPQLDAFVYLGWARDIAGGDLAGREGVIEGLPFFFNPLYAYAIAPFLRGAPELQYPVEPILDELAPHLLAILVAQCLLGGATTWLTVRTASHHLGRLGGWVAGIAVACSTSLVHLDHHFAVSGLAAFLCAGFLHSMLPRLEGDGRRYLGARGPMASALWLGLGALARPIPLLVLPIALLWYARRSPVGWRAAAVLLLVFAGTAVPTLSRNWLVAGQPHLYTAAGGVNIHLGNNPLARTSRSMATHSFRFGPLDMHEDARRHMQSTLQLPEPPSWGEVSTYYRDEARREFAEHPWDSFVHYLNKARWFCSPVEVPSSASLESDLAYTPWLRAAFVPTGWLAALGLIGVVLLWRRPEVVVAPAGMLAAHVATLTLVFPLSHYRSPAVPALAVLAAGVAVHVLERWREGRVRAALLPVGCAVVVAIVGALPPQPNELRVNGLMVRAFSYRDITTYPQSPDPEVDVRLREDARQRARELAAFAMEVHRTEAPSEMGLAAAHFLLAELAHAERDIQASIRHMETGLSIESRNVEMRIALSCAYQYVGRLDEALAQAERAVRDAPRMPVAVQRLAEALVAKGRRRDAEPYLDALRRAGVPMGDSCAGE